MTAATSAKIVGLDGRPLSALYDGASNGRRTAGWHATSSGPNREIGSSLRQLRDRHRDLCRNNPWARRAVQAIVNNTIGDGIRAQWQDPQVQSLWSSWFESTAIDASGRLDGYGLQALVLRTVVESGEVLVRKRPRRTADGYDLPLQIQVLEPDHIDTNKTELLRFGHITQGIEFDGLGQRRSYWLYPEHPGDPIGRRAIESLPYIAADLAHVYRLDRPGQVRGVPWGTGAMMRLRMLDDYQDAQLERQRIAACYVAFVRDTDVPLNTDDQSELLDKLEPGAIEILPPGKDMSFASPPQPDDDKDFQLSVLRAVASDYGIPYETLTGDLSEVNFSSARMGWNEFARNIDVWRWQMLAPQMLRPLVDWFREAAALVGVDVRQEQPLWTAPARVMVDSTREVPAVIKAVRAGLLSLPQAIRQLGYDPETLITEQAEFLRRLDALGLVLDTDPRRDVNRETPEEQTDDQN